MFKFLQEVDGKGYQRYLTLELPWGRIIGRPGRTAADGTRKCPDEESPGSTGQG